MSDNFDDFDDEAEIIKQEALKSDLTPEQYDKLMKDMENFNHSFLSYLADTAQYEVIPTDIDFDQYLEEEHYKSVKEECKKIGAKILYTYEIGKSTIVLNPNNCKTVIIVEGEVH